MTHRGPHICHLQGAQPRARLSGDEDGSDAFDAARATEPINSFTRPQCVVQKITATRNMTPVADAPQTCHTPGAHSQWP
jgi:hypothetical protein